ncbi:amidohydrolase family protein [Novipirellula artificiosorum]|uniref:Aminodeoxyfutalosine deaminase n=1 Tax=Novipirellula artificiosorum TaxID=2528016 RepID=A0A5C6DZ31_9BACT|nr:amidohydrolase family protein [Novipirellula artificiosorum]TWU41087.1 Aminodeoxyfutalosine deaminase [Novipirellula artificiosorum]
MSTLTTSVIAARWIFPISGPPFYHGWIRIRDQRVTEFGSGQAPRGAVDLGDVAILPQLVNAHTHLEFSDCTVPVGEVGVTLDQWIGEVVAARKNATEESKAKAIRAGVEESARAGVALVGEIATPPVVGTIEAGTIEEGGMEIISFAETLGLSESRGAERLAAARHHLQSFPTAGISPHAPYSTTPEVIQQCIELAIRHRRPLAMHVAESPSERELLESATGPMADRLKTMGVWREGLFPWPKDPFCHLIAMLAKAPRSLLIHGNDLRPNEMACVAKHPQMTVVFCPRTHAFFGYPRHPVDLMLRHGIPVALGTDSRASNPDLNLWDEVRFLLNHRQDLDPQDVLAMATIHGANALGRLDLGRIRGGSLARFGCVPTDACSLQEAMADLARGDRLQPVFIPTCNPSGA